MSTDNNFPEEFKKFLFDPDIFMTPNYLAPSAWLEHIPFAFWLVKALKPKVIVELGTHFGVSYFAFCQAVDRYGLSTKCYAVDSWEGDDQAGFFGPEVYEKVHTHNDTFYSRFSVLIKSSFDEAVHYFIDGSIDLLHIDGYHTYEAVLHDFEVWKPKLSDSSVVVFHDTNVRERNFGVFKLLNELKQIYPCFEFPHGHGLSVVGVGKNSSRNGLKSLFSLVEDDHSLRVVFGIFGRLGRACNIEAFKFLEEQKFLETQKLIESSRNETAIIVKERDDAIHERDIAVQERKNIFRDNNLKNIQIIKLKEDKICLEKEVVDLNSQNSNLSKLYFSSVDNLAAKEETLGELKLEVVQMKERLWRETNRADTLERSFEKKMVTFFRLLAWPARKIKQKIQLKADLKQLERCYLFDAKWYLEKYPDVRDSGIKPSLHYLLHGATELRDPGPIFSSGFYFSSFPDVKMSGQNPLIHFIKFGEKEGRSISPKGGAGELISDFSNAENGRNLNPFLSQKQSIFSQNFDINYYQENNPDVKENCEDAFQHYIQFGFNEGRKPCFDFSSFFSAGKVSFDPSKSNLLIVCHEASLTGAPILGLRLIQEIQGQFNVIGWLLRKGSIFDEFCESCIGIISGAEAAVDVTYMIKSLEKKFGFFAVILNSSVTATLARQFFENKIPVVSLVHEYPDYMGKQILDLILYSNYLIFPAQSLNENSKEFCRSKLGFFPTNTLVRHQGRCIPPKNLTSTTFSVEEIFEILEIKDKENKPAIVLGCGSVQIRKGIEYFVETARFLKKIWSKPFFFIWVGAGYKPDDDLHYSAWIKSQILHSSLDNEVIFFEETSDLDPFFEIADVFFLSSRLDPFPNVAIDAVFAKVPVVSFEKASGFSDFIEANPGVGITVPYLDSMAAAKSIKKCLSSEFQFSAEDDFLQKEFPFSNYANFILNVIKKAEKNQEQIEEESRFIENSKKFDSEFFKSGFFRLPWSDSLTSEFAYVSFWNRGIKMAKSCIGFNDKTAEQSHGASSNKENFITPLAKILSEQSLPETHKTILFISSNGIEKFVKKNNVAIHLHAYYLDQLPSFLNRIEKLIGNLFVLITTDTEIKAEKISKILKNRNENMKVLCVPNRGRDIGPFLLSFNGFFLPFDIIGHFHFKGTKELATSMVNQWQQFIFDTLIGSHGEVAAFLINQFEKNPSLGLCFPEDPCLSSIWGENRGLAEKLLKKIGVNRSTPDIVEYPIGNMFWCRKKALIPLFEHEWEISDFPAEPVPYDGSDLHALERLTPTICEETGYEWKTVHVSSAFRYSH